MPEQLIDPGITIHYLDYHGEKPAGVLLLHGLGATCHSWQLQTPALLDAGYRVIVPDMRGFGNSTYPGGSNNPEIMARDMARLVNGLDLEKVHLVVPLFMWTVITDKNHQGIIFNTKFFGFVVD